MHKVSGRTAVLLGVKCVILLQCGCSSWFKSRPNLSAIGERRENIKEKLESDARPTIVSQIGSPAMLTFSRLQNIGLVTQLNDSGGTVKASPQREKLLDEMRRKEADQPNQVLDDETTTMVVATVDVGPAARPGAILDAGVSLSTHAEATDLEHGFLMETPLMEMSRLGGQVREGFEKAVARGQIVTRHQLYGDDGPENKLAGVVIGGARLLKERQLGISIDSGFADAITMAAVIPAINTRFTHFDGRKQTGIATPREDSYIELAVPPRYQHDPFHFVNVVLQTSFNESEQQRTERLTALTRQLREPTTVRAACWQLEAQGESSIPTLAAALDDPDPEIRFYAAHSLAYLNDNRSIPVLSSLCLQEPAFRAMCLNGLVILDHFEATDALRELLHAADPEVKYGAVRALRLKDSQDPHITGDRIHQAGDILEIPTSGPPLVAVSLTIVPEVVIFGETPVLDIPEFQYVNEQMLVSPNSAGGFTISRFRRDEEDQLIQTKPDLRSVLTAIAEVGGTYGDWVKFIRECHTQGYFAEPFALNPVPQPGRTYQRDTMVGVEPGDALFAQTIIEPSVDDKLEDAATRGIRKVWYNPWTWGSETSERGE